MDKYDRLIQIYRDKLNKTIYTGEWVKITQDRIDNFAKVTGDKQWIHTDPEKAKILSPYKTTIAHGFLTLSMIPYLTKSNSKEYFQKNYPEMSLRINYGLNRVRFPSPVKVNSSIRAKMMPISVKRIDNGVEIIYKITVEIKDEEKPACVAEQIVRLY
ncbi:MaoC family dehydratase [Hippea maritima]|uniref:Enoyl-CoA hydratase n=1 Tax=Hippea maritima (strain ATCC 700847 / DSM 10411 / MH2) TaxID=760142 RepID=F2LUD5_HIPMA|nr:MaoC family dehydratase [Hippea maritima]AEA33461.1 Enoyl-CoA hydratase [Hippea maritima DSM 10411]